MFEWLTKKIATSKYSGKLGRSLRTRYGKLPHYSPAQVERTIDHLKLNQKYIIYAMALYVSAEEFKTHFEKHPELHSGETSHESVRSEMARQYNAGDLSFDANSFIDPGSSGPTSILGARGGGYESGGFDGDAGSDGE